MTTVLNEQFDLYLRPDTWDFNICLEQRHYMPLDIKPDSIILDLGAHIGSFAKLAIELNAKKVICFEAAKDNFDVLKLNAKLHPQIEAYHRVITSDPKAKSLQLQRHSGINTGMHSIYRKTGTGTERVVTYDFEKAFEVFEPDFVKVDIEGSEYFLNWKSALRIHKPLRMVIEYHLDLPTFRSVALPCHELIMTCGYQCYKAPDFTHAHQTYAFYERL